MNIHLQIGNERHEFQDLNTAFREVHEVLHLRWVDYVIMGVFDQSYRGVTLQRRPTPSRKMAKQQNKVK